MDNQKIYHEIITGAQMMFTAFGALVLVPLLTGLDSNTALLGCGVGTLLFQFVTKRQVPVFLGSSFVFMPAIIYGIKTWGVPGTLCGLAASGFMYVIIAGLLRWKGTNFLHKLLPPIVTGPIIMLIGLILAPVAVNMAMGKTGDGSAVLVVKNKAMILALVTMVATASISIFAKGFAKLTSILCGMIIGYGTSLLFYKVNFDPIVSAPWFAIPKITTPEWNLEAIIYILPIAFAPAVEHFGDILAIGQVTGKDFLKNPGVHRTLLGDGLATMFAGMIGAPPNTTYSEVTGAVALTRAFNPRYMTYAAILAVLFSFIGKLGAILQTIPTPVIGGILILLFGNIFVIGLSLLIKDQVDATSPRNMVIMGIMIVCGVGGLSLEAGSVALKGVGLASFLGVFLNLLIPKKFE